MGRQRFVIERRNGVTRFNWKLLTAPLAIGVAISLAISHVIGGAAYYFLVVGGGLVLIVFDVRRVRRRVAGLKSPGHEGRPNGDDAGTAGNE